MSCAVVTEITEGSKVPHPQSWWPACVVDVVGVSANFPVMLNRHLGYQRITQKELQLKGLSPCGCWHSFTSRGLGCCRGCAEWLLKPLGSTYVSSFKSVSYLQLNYRFLCYFVVLHVAVFFESLCSHKPRL